MKKVIIPARGGGGGGGNLPPLVVVSAADQIKPIATNPIQPVLIKAVSPATSPAKLSANPTLVTHDPLHPSSTSHMRLVQTADGKKLLLTNVVNVSKASSSKQVILMSRNSYQAISSSSNTSYLTSAGQPAITPVLSTNTPQTVVLSPSKSVAPVKEPKGGQPIVLRIPGINQPILVRQQPLLPAGSGGKSSVLPAKVPRVMTRSSNTTASTTTTSTVTSPITSPTANPNPVMYLKSGAATFKVVGKPVPVKLFPKLQKIAPKDHPTLDVVPAANTTTTTTTTTTATPTLPLPPLTSPEKSPEPGATGKPLALPEPPAYLNIKVKEEPEPLVEELGSCVNAAAIKTEQEDLHDEEFDDVPEMPQAMESMLDVRIKEEPTDEQSELLARDEQLREVLGVTDSFNTDHRPKFYIRTAEGKLVSIAPDEAQALGLDHQDKVENNQRKLMRALGSAKTAILHKVLGNEGALKWKTNPNILIPGNVNVKEFVSCHVSPVAEKTATIMKNLGSKRLGTNTKSILAPKSNTAIIGEFEENNRRYLKIEIETEANGKDLCDVPITPVNTYQCPFCARDFKTKDHVISHIRIHTGERPYPCDVCGKRYRQRIDIIRHMRIHTGEKPFNCGLCNASFNQKSNLRSHMRIHTGERPVQCKVCGKGFSRNTHLKQHMKLHTGEKPFQCKVCDRPFRFKSGLQAHERIHSGLKPYACSLCGRTFTQIVGLLRHERTHVGEKPFRCQSCGKSFDSRDTLKSHVMKHTGERPHTCDLCNKTFTDLSALRCHRKKYHSNMLICVICLREDFKDRIELREHLRAHERENWRETEEGDLVPLVREGESHFVSVDDTMEDEEVEESEEHARQVEGPMDGHHVEVQLEPDNPMDDDQEDSENASHEDEIGDSDYEEHELHIEDHDPLA